jgi:hypothetical protein
MCPRIQSDTVGWLTPIAFPNSSCVMRGVCLSNHSWSLRTPPNIGHSDIKAIGPTYISLSHYGAMPHKTEKTVWKRVKEALQDAGLPPTQKQAAKLIGGKQGSISDWNKPNRYPTIDNAVTIAKATNTCVEWIYRGTGPKHPGPPEEATAEELWNLWGRLDDVGKGKVLGVAADNALDAPKRQIADSSGLQRRASSQPAFARNHR